jgi:type IV pilus assembly protein PilM
VFAKKYWIASLHGRRWVVAKVSRRRTSLNIVKIAEFNGEDTLPLVSETDLAKQLESAKREEEYVHTLRTWLKQQRVPLKKLRFSLSCSGVITRIIVLPLLSPKELDKLLTEQVDQYFTLNISDYIVDYRVLEKFDEDGQMRQRILLAAIPKNEWEKQWNVWQQLGFTPKVVDFAADSLARLYTQVSRRGEKAKKEQSELPDLAIVNLGTDRVEFVLLEHGVFFLYSDLEIDLTGLEEYTKTLDNVEKNSKPSQGDSTQASPSGVRALELTEIWVRSEMEGILNPVLQTLSDFLAFFASRHFGKVMDEIYLTGEYSGLPYVEEIFERGLEIRTRVGFPNGWHPYYNRRSRPLQKNWMKYGSLYGLAFRED